MTTRNRGTRGTLVLTVVAVAALVLTLALPIGAMAGSVLPQATHLQQNWSKSHAATPTPLSNCILPSAATGDDCYNPGTHLMWTLSLDVCTSSTTTCTGSTQDTVVLTSVVALLPPGETYLTGSQTAVTSPSNAAVFTTGSCSSGSAPADCVTLSVPTDTFLRWNFTSPSLNGHPQALFTYTANLTAADGAILDDFAIAHYTVLGLSQNPVVSDEVFVANPILDIAKTCPLQVENNSPVVYNVTLSNSGHQNASGVTMSDPAVAGVTFTGASATSPTASFTPTLGSWTGTIVANGSVKVTFDANLNTSASSVKNVANYTAFPAAATFIHHNASCTTQVVHPKIAVKKTVDPTLVSNLAAHQINVSANVTNPGDTTLFNVTAVDSLAGALTCNSTTLPPNGWTICTGHYTIPKGDSAKFSNDTVNATGNDKFGFVVKAHDHASVQIIHPAIDVVKVVNPTLVTNLQNNTITIKAHVTNTGDTTLTGITVVDSIAGALSCPSTTLTAGASMNCTGSYVIPKGTSPGFSNDTVVATGTDSLNEHVSANDSASVQIVHPAITVVKVVNPTLVSNVVNNTISITAHVTNTGGVTLFNITVVDSIAGALTCPATSLASGASMNCTGSYVIPKGTTAKFSNDTVTAGGDDGHGNHVSDNATASVQIVHPAISVVKVVNPTVVSNATNNTINITAHVTNTGDVTLFNITVIDSIAGTLTCPTTTLVKGASMNCTGSYVIPKGTPAGFSNDTVTATGCDATDHCVSDHSHASVIINAPSTPGGVTDTQFCPLPNGQFRIILNGGANGFQLKSTNPGQFYYNVFSTAGWTSGSSITVTIPYPFTTSGANAIQVFENQPLPTCPSSPPATNINSQVHISPTVITLSSYSPQNFGSTVTVTLKLTGATIAPGNQLWIAIHLGYGLKGQFFSKIAAGSAGCPTPANTGPCAKSMTTPTLIIGNLQSYTFGNSLGGSTTIASFNSFGNGAAPAFQLSLAGNAGLRLVTGVMFAVVGLVVFQRQRKAGEEALASSPPA